MILAEILDNNKIVMSEHKNTDAIADGVKFETVCFLFPKSWEGFQKTAVFSTDDKTINVVLSKGNDMCLSDTECYIPYEVLKDCEFNLSVFGVKGDSIATSSKETVRVLESGYALGESPKNPTQSEYQQIINITESAKALADSVRRDADNGIFKGDKGEKGDKGDKGDQGIKGDKGEKGDPGNIENIDIAFNPESENAQSGKAVASAVANVLKAETDSEWVFDGGDAFSGIGIDFSIDNEISDESTNPVANKTVKKYVDSNIKNVSDKILSSIDNEMSDESINPVANKTVKKYVDSNIKNVNDKILPLADYIVESGTSDIWTYRKWNSGIVECWGTTDFVEFKTNTPWGCLYAEVQSNGYLYIKNVHLPEGLFKSIDSTVANIHADGSVLIPYTVCWNTQIDYSALSPVETENSRTCKFHFIVKGHWK